MVQTGEHLRVEVDFSRIADYLNSASANGHWRSAGDGLTVVLDVDSAKALADHICAVISGAHVDTASDCVVVPRGETGTLARMLVWWVGGKRNCQIRAGSESVVSGADALSLATMLTHSARVILEDFGDQEVEVLRL